MRHKNEASPSHVSFAGSPTIFHTDAGATEVPAPVPVSSFRKPNPSTEANMLLRRALEEVNVHRLLKRKMEEIGNGDEAQDFIIVCRLAHIFHFGTDPEQTQAYLNWKQHGIIPKYVEKWLVQ